MKNFRNNKILTILGIFVLSVIVFTGCINNDPSEPIVDEPTEQEQMEEDPFAEEQVEDGF